MKLFKLVTNLSISINYKNNGCLDGFALIGSAIKDLTLIENLFVTINAHSIGQTDVKYLVEGIKNLKLLNQLNINFANRGMI